MALAVLLILLCLVFTYCCWGTCCKFFRKNRRRRSTTSVDSCADPRLMMLWPSNAAAVSPMGQNQLQEQQRPARPLKPRVQELPPPPYESLFCQPPTYSSLALETEAISSSSQAVPIGQFLRSQSVPSFCSSSTSSQITHIAVLIRTENQEV